VLVVDDDDVCRLAATTLLEGLGLVADVASDGRQALEMTAKWPYVAVFMDCSMPEIDGFAAATQIARRDGTGRHTLVIAMTVHPRTLCLASGMDFHIAKPLQIDELRDDCTQLGLLTRAGGSETEPAAISRPDTPLVRLPAEDIAGNDPILAAELALTFIAQASLGLPELWRAVNASDWPALRRFSNEVGQPAAVVGVVRVADLCDRLSKAAHSRQATAAAAIEPQLRQALADTAAAIRSRLDRTYGALMTETIDEADMESAPGEDDSPSSSPMRVAIADDDPFARVAIEMMIGGADGLALIGSADGVAEIVEFASLEQPDVVVLDWMMPGGGGPEAARRILRRSPGMPIVALTSSDSHEAFSEMTRAGACGFLVKGGPPEKFVQTIRQALEMAA
jgi:CheY-like chemotaxis protein